MRKLSAKSIIAAFISAYTLFAFGCASEKTPPETPPTYTGEVPEITDGGYAKYETVRVFDAPLKELRRFIEDGNKIVQAMEETESIKKPVDVVVVHGTWPEEGSVRRLEFSDGHFTLERVIENNFPTLFRYQVFAYTAKAADNLEYALGQQAWEVLPDGRAQLTWTYRLKPNAWYKRFFVQRFVDNNMQPLMDGALDRVKARAEAHFPSQVKAANP